MSTTEQRKKRWLAIKDNLPPHLSHGTQTVYWYGCRCEECKIANKERCERNREARVKKDPGNIKHGLSGYMNYRCRCPICKAAKAADTKSPKHREYQRNWNAEQRRKLRESIAAGGPLPEGYKHGSRRVSQHGCPCSVCEETRSKKGR